MANIAANLPDKWEELLRVALPTDIVLDPVRGLVTRESEYPEYLTELAH